jgi:hypothetical protein
MNICSGFTFNIGLSNLRYSDTVASSHNYSNLSGPDDPPAPALFLSVKQSNCDLAAAQTSLGYQCAPRACLLIGFTYRSTYARTHRPQLRRRFLVDRQIVTYLLKRIHLFMDPERSIPSLQEPAIGHCPEPHVLSPDPIHRSNVTSLSTHVSSEVYRQFRFSEMF